MTAVAGKRYGKGSSREHSVVAERAAGIGLLIAENSERIYRQNADNVGLATPTDFGLLERIRTRTRDASIAARCRRSSRARAIRAAARGTRVPTGTTLYLQYGTVDVRDCCVRLGYLSAFEAVGAVMLEPAASRRACSGRPAHVI